MLNSWRKLAHWCGSQYDDWYRRRARADFLQEMVGKGCRHKWMLAESRISCKRCGYELDGTPPTA